MKQPTLFDPSEGLRFTPHDNGANLSPKEIARLTPSVNSQTAAVIDFYNRKPGNWTAEEIHRKVLPTAPLTSVRRCLTDLCSAGILVKSDLKKMGNFGIEIHTYTLDK